MASIESYKRLQDVLKSEASDSDTYYGNANPTNADLALNRKIASSESAKDAAASALAKKRWYPTSGDKNPDTVSDANKEEKSYIGNLLKGLSLPIYAGVGVVESLTGKGTKNNIFDNIKPKAFLILIMKR